MSRSRPSLCKAFWAGDSGERAGATISLDFERILDVARAEGFEPEHRGAWPIGGQVQGAA